MLMTTKNGRAIARIIAIAMCAVMLLAFATGCSDDTAARAEEAYNAALKAEEAANKANQAAKDAQTSADNALAEAEKAESLAGTKTTEEEIAELLKEYVDSDKLAEELAKLINEEAVKALIDEKADAAEEAIMAEIEKVLNDYGCPELQDEIEKIAKDVLDKYEAVQDNNDAVLEALLGLIEARNAALANVAANPIYDYTARNAVNDAYEIAQITILCANNEQDIADALEVFEEELENLPDIVDALYARIKALEGKVVVAIPGTVYGDDSGTEIANISGAISSIMGSTDLRLEDIKEKLEAYTVDEGDTRGANLKERAGALSAQYTNLSEAFANVETVNDALDVIKDYATKTYQEVVNGGFGTAVDGAVQAYTRWYGDYIDGTEGDTPKVEKENADANIARMIPLLALIDDDTAEGVEEDFADVDSAVEYVEYVRNLPTKYINAIDALVGAIVDGAETQPATKYNNGAGYILASELKTLTDFNTALLAENDKFDGENNDAGFLADITNKNVFDDALNYGKYADQLKTAYDTDADGIKTALTALVNAVKEGLSIDDVYGENNMYSTAVDKYNSWYNTNAADGILYVAVEDEVVVEILGDDTVENLEKAEERAPVLLEALNAAAAINSGYVYNVFVKAFHYDANATYYTLNEGTYAVATVNNETEFTTAVEGYYVIDKTFDAGKGILYYAAADYTVTYSDIIALDGYYSAAEGEFTTEGIDDVVAAWAEYFDIALPETEAYVDANYDMVKHEELNAALEAANELIDAALESDSAKAFIDAVNAFKSYTNDGKDLSKLYGYLLVSDAYAAGVTWRTENNLTAVAGVEAFEKKGLLPANLATLKSKYEAAGGALYNAEAAYKRNDINETIELFSADDFLETYEPSLYDADLRAAYAAAKAWVEAYLNANADFEITANGKTYTIDSLGLLDETTWTNIKTAYETVYTPYVNNAKTELDAIASDYAKFYENNAPKFNLITDGKEINAINKKATDWTGTYVKTGTIDDKFADYATIIEKATELYTAYTTAYGDAENNFPTVDLENYVVDKYGKVTGDLKTARDSYNEWAEHYLIGVAAADLYKSGAYDNKANNDLTVYAAINDWYDAIVAIETNEKAAQDLADVFAARMDGFIEKLDALEVGGITASDVAALRDLQTAYDAWWNELSADDQNKTLTTFYDADAQQFKVDLDAADIIADDIEAKLTDVKNALAKFDGEGDDDVTALDSETIETSAGFTGVANDYITAYNTLEEAIKAYLAVAGAEIGAVTENVATFATVPSAFYANTMMTADEIDLYYGVRATAGSVDAIQATWDLFVEYSDQVGEDATIADPLVKVTALESVRDDIIRVILDDAAEDYKVTEEDAAEAIARAYMSDIMAATGEVTTPKFEDIGNDFENWEKTTD